MPDKTGRLLTALAGTGLLLIATASSAAAWARPQPRPPAVDPGPVQIHSADATHQYRFRIALPAGDRLKPLSAASAGTTGEVLVQNAHGTAIGAYDAAWAADADGRPLATSYRVSGNLLIQTVAFDRQTHFPITLDPGYSPIGASAGAGADPAPGSSFSPLLGAAASAVTKVTVPANYVYNPALGYLHDYCTDSPDEFPAPGAPNADFRGPCARHDLCYAGSTDEFACDNALRKDLYTNCAYYYSAFSLLRPLCKATADVYWAAVVIT